ncbi:MAG TPA: hydrolase 2, exosortase A system-associated [Telluria sp.]|nr:hydrolase 2, exosortase A system-associated [Telluria sp.]
MTPPAGPARANPFFLEAEQGQRFCLYHPPGATTYRGAVLYIHPFAEEMNKSRRMAALQARMLTALGYGVLQLDLYGCGDSSGDFADARWEIWKHDLALAHRWLEQRLPGPVHLWGLRIGAMLALDYAAGADAAPASLALWQPPLSGKQFLTQFLRLRVANDMLSNNRETGNGTAALRAQLQAGGMLEIAGYDLAPALADAIDALDLLELRPATGPVHWFEAVAAAGRPLPPGAARVGAAWTDAGVDLRLQTVACAPFWSTAEVTECPELLAATTAVFSQPRDVR